MPIDGILTNHQKPLFYDSLTKWSHSHAIRSGKKRTLDAITSIERWQSILAIYKLKPINWRIFQLIEILFNENVSNAINASGKHSLK